ncbi:uncharacterized protein LOC110440229 [Mizuhopecten yessoensis]|uniref:SCO-spondin n=1 Tax=Mizuhopecten yessoensis TaxID=6573 RepID=A0A210PLN4_MIZYE|nr:uncharacterized protein LOC110440229 [Mizuhopecten yessoensis]OWF37393.1 SCO-spondin [Mizuhopecten yessoensis]
MGITCRATMEYTFVIASFVMSAVGLILATGFDQNAVLCGETMNIMKQDKYIIRYLSDGAHDIIPTPKETENRTVRMLQQKRGSLQLRKCRINIKTSPGYRLQINIQYIPQYSGCNQGYFHIGNDKYRSDRVSMTSYKFCDVVRGLEIISRENYMWMVYDVNQQKTMGEILIEAYPDARCNSSSFECSPVQCIQPGRVCDGRTDCRNGRDEFCGNIRNDVEKRIPETKGPCFLCLDDTVICPSLPLYNDDRGHELWFMCDRIDHCKDGSDERLDMCYQMKRKGNAAMMFECVPHLDGGYHGNTTVRMWEDRVCDGIQDCRNREDENECSEENPKGKTSIHPVAVTVVACFLLSVLSGATVFIYKTGKKRSFTMRLDVMREGPALDPSETFRLDTVTEEPEMKS